MSAAGRPGSRGGALAAALVAALAGGCVSQTTADAIHDVATLRTGTVNELRALRGTGPLRRYALAPDAMLEAAAEACRRMRDLAGRPVTGVTISRHYGEVVAKERAPCAPEDPGYSYEWRSAVVVTVHAVPGDPHVSDVEIHATRRSPMLGNAVDWEHVLPPALDAVLRERREGATPAR